MSAALTSILSQVSTGDYYTAHQKARTTSTRLLARAGSDPSRGVEASELLWEVARALLEKGQVGSGVDLAGLLVGTWKTREVACGEKERGALTVRWGLCIGLVVRTECAGG
jgi:hypothetical protein